MSCNEVLGSDVYVGGKFDFAGGIGATSIAKWDGTSWSSLGSGLTYSGGAGTCHGIAFYETDVYVVGLFTSAGATAANNFAKWNGSSWGAPTPSFTVNSTIYGILIKYPWLYICGDFININGSEAAGVARLLLISNTWFSVWPNNPIGLNLNTFYTMTSDDTRLYLGGLLFNLYTMQIGILATYHFFTEEINVYTNTLAGVARSIRLVDNYLYIAGIFPEYEGFTGTSNIMKINVNTLPESTTLTPYLMLDKVLPVELGLNYECYALDIDDNNNAIYVGGRLQSLIILMVVQVVQIKLYHIT